MSWLRLSDRSSWTAMRSGLSSRPNASASLAATISSRPTRLSGPSVSSARVEALSRCCPPGPLERLAVHSAFLSRCSTTVSTSITVTSRVNHSRGNAMLSKDITELLCRVGAGTVMGDMMRQYWLRCVYSWELTPDCDTVRVRMLGEDLIAWRDSNGAPSFVANNCPHRGASLFFGRNEESGLRCVYHGWKFDASGQCIDMPNEPAESDCTPKVKPLSYRAAHACGITCT